MRTIFYTELLKLKRTNLFQVGMTIVVLSCIFSIIPIFAADDTIKDYALIMCNILENNCMYFSTVLITLMGSYMMSREYTDDTLKNLLLIPMTFQNILSGKLLTLLFMTVICGLASTGNNRWYAIPSSGNQQYQYVYMDSAHSGRKFFDLYFSASYYHYHLLHRRNRHNRNCCLIYLWIFKYNRLEANEFLSCKSCFDFIRSCVK